MAWIPVEAKLPPEVIIGEHSLFACPESSLECEVIMTVSLHTSIS